MTKDEILQLAKEKGIKLSFLNGLIGGYRGKLTDWKNGKTSLKENEIELITDYLLGNETEGKSLDEQLKGIDFALHSESKELTDGEKQDVLNFVKFIKAKRENDK